MDIPGKLETTLNNIQLLENHDNAKLIYDFYLYLRSVNTSESYQNQNIKALINMAKFFGKDIEFIRISKKEEILSFLNTKIKSKEEDPDGKWMRTWNDSPTNSISLTKDSNGIIIAQFIKPTP